ncbi:hypothetical protein [Salinirubrum litoreum]|uniref:Glycine zipper family protein n=1 Tax=Salinirubrum litoreum TaxID=1126234 RepID=A0ABD5RB37_9EURY|nr:hypothetical protein [Salinirubrum litoreum]
MSNTTLDDDSAETEDKNQLDPVFMGAGMFLGAALGLVVGFTLDMPALGAGTGMLLGMSSGIALGFWKTNQ